MSSLHTCRQRCCSQSSLPRCRCSPPAAPLLLATTPPRTASSARRLRSPARAGAPGLLMRHSRAAGLPAPPGRNRPRHPHTGPVRRACSPPLTPAPCWAPDSPPLPAPPLRSGPLAPPGTSRPGLTGRRRASWCACRARLHSQGPLLLQGLCCPPGAAPADRCPPSSCWSVLDRARRRPGMLAELQAGSAGRACSRNCRRSAPSWSARAAGLRTPSMLYPGPPAPANGSVRGYTAVAGV